MKIQFSLNQVSLIQAATIRYAEVYDLVRSYKGISVGAQFDKFDLIDCLTSSFIQYKDEFGSDMISIRGTEIDLTVCLHAIRTLIALENIQVSLNAFVNHECSLSAVSKTVKHAKQMIDAVEW